MSQLFVCSIIVYLPRHTAEEGPERIASEGHQRVARDPTTEYTLFESCESVEWNILAAMQSDTCADAGSPYERYGEGVC